NAVWWNHCISWRVARGGLPFRRGFGWAFRLGRPLRSLMAPLRPTHPQTDNRNAPPTPFFLKDGTHLGRRGSLPFILVGLVFPTGVPHFGGVVWTVLSVRPTPIG